jgi:hypothetical protein
MSETLRRVQMLVPAGEMLVSRHGLGKLGSENIFLGTVVSGVGSAATVEDYPDAMRGPTVLVLQQDQNGRPMHVLWGIQKGTTSPAVLITAYRPDPLLWSTDFMRRSKT